MCRKNYKICTFWCSKKNRTPVRGYGSYIISINMVMAYKWVGILLPARLWHVN
jgi:hypothetical protein